MLNKQISEITFKDLNELLYLKGLTESQTIELKKELSGKNGTPEGKEFAKDVTAFANAVGGYLLVGIDEKKQEICGTNTIFGNQKIEDWISNVLNDLVDKTLDYRLVQILISEEENLNVVILEVPEGKDKPYYVMADKKPIPYIRKGTSVFTARPADIKEMYAVANKEKEGKEIEINQKAVGKNIQQIGQHFGNVIHTNRFQQKTEVLYEPSLYITDQQAKQIKDKIDEIVDIHDKAGKFKTREGKSKFYAQTWQSLRNRFGVTKYTLLPKNEFEECMKWLQSQIAFKHTPILRRSNNPEWKNKRYGAIYAKARNDWRMDKEEVYEFAFQKLKLKQPISSLKDLNDTKLNKLYKILFEK
jgi:hypothetical protein